MNDASASAISCRYIHSPTLGHCCERKKWLQYFVVPNEAFSLLGGTETDIGFRNEFALAAFKLITELFKIVPLVVAKLFVVDSVAVVV